MWKILQEPCVPRIMTLYFHRLFVHLLFQVFFSTLDMPEEVDTFWKGCQQEHGLATSPDRCSLPVLLSPPHCQGRSQCSPSVTRALLYTQVCAADPEVPALPSPL